MADCFKRHCHAGRQHYGTKPGGLGTHRQVQKAIVSIKDWEIENNSSIVVNIK